MLFGLPRLLWISYLRYLAKNLWLLLLSVSAIATGVSVILAVDIASSSAKRSFELSVSALTGTSNYAIVGAGSPIDESVYRKLRVDWQMRRSAPVVEGFVAFENSEDKGSVLQSQLSLKLLGVDPLADAEFRNWTGGITPGSGFGESNLTNLIGSDRLVLASESTAKRLNWEVGQEKTVLVGKLRRPLKLAGVVSAAEASSSSGLDNILLADISTAQVVLGKVGQLDRIDLFLSSESEKISLERLLGPGLFVQEAGQSQKTASALSEAFHTNLGALSYLCLLVGTFLIVNVVSFSVSHRRQGLGKLRILGVTAKEVTTLIILEASILGVIGSLIGTTAGLLLGRFLVPLVSQTINDLYYVHSITNFEVGTLLVVKALACGILSTFVASLFPALCAGQAEPLELLHRVAGSGERLRAARNLALCGLGTLTLAWIVVSHSSLLAGLICLLLVVLGAVSLVPLALIFMADTLSRWPRDVASKMALRGVSAHIERTGMAAIALTLAVAATVSIGTMVSSFRGTLTSWLETTLAADVYITLKHRAALSTGETLDPLAVKKALALPGTSDWLGQRMKVVPSETGETFLIGVRCSEAFQETLVFVEKEAEAWQRFSSGQGVFLTEPYARRARKEVGDTLSFSTFKGEIKLPVLGVYYSYAPDRNMALVADSVVNESRSSMNWSGLGLYLDQSVSLPDRLQELRRTFGEDVEIVATRDMKALALTIFERTFTVTKVLRILALGVAFIGVFLSLMALVYERKQEITVLRSLGFQKSELFRLSLVQSGLLGILSGILALPLGAALAAIMISVINRRAFGWTITYASDWSGASVSLALAVAASVLAGFYPAWLWSRGEGDEVSRQRE